MSNWKVGPGGRLYHPTTGAYVGQLDLNGNEQMVPVMATLSDQGVGSGYAKTLAQAVGEEQLALNFDIALTRMDYDMRRLGRLGVGNKAVLALRFDHHTAVFRDTIKPLLDARGLPYQMNTHVTELDGSKPANPTWADVAQWQYSGCEYFTHGIDHMAYPNTYQGLWDNVVGCKKTAEANGLIVKGWAMPGLGEPWCFDGLNVLDDWRGAAGRLLMSNYAIAEAYSGPILLPVTPQPNRYFYGRAHNTIDAATLATATGWIDTICRDKKSMRVMCHVGLLGTASFMALASYTTWLDYIVAKRDAGELEIVLPSALPYVTNDTTRLDLLCGTGSFVGVSSSNLAGWTALGGTYADTEQTGGYNNGPKLVVAIGKSSASYVVRECTGQGYNGEHFVFEGYCQGNVAGTDTAKVVITDGLNWTLTKTISGVVPGTWTKVIFPFMLPKLLSNGQTLQNITIQIGRNGGTSGTEWSNVSIKKI